MSTPTEWTRQDKARAWWMHSDAAVLLRAVLVVVAGFAVVLGFCYAVFVIDCNARAETTGLATNARFGLCYVRHEDRWVTWSEHLAILSRPQL